MLGENFVDHKVLAEIVLPYCNSVNKDKVDQTDKTEIISNGSNQDIEKWILLIQADVLDLWKGDKSGYDGDHSKADFALVSRIYHYVQDPDIIDSIFRSSGLIRDKWDEIHSSKGLTYGEMTIKAAIESYSGAFYQPEDQATEVAHKFLQSQESCSDTLNFDKLPLVLTFFIDRVSKITDASPIMILMSVLVSASAVLKTKVYYEYFDGRLYPNLWMLAIAPSGAFKTTALNVGRRIIERIDDEILKQIQKLKSAKTENEEQKEEYEGKILQLEKTLSVLPDKITLEGLVCYLVNHGGAIFCSEFGAWLKSLTAGTNIHGLKELFTHLYDVPRSYRYLTKTSGDYILRLPFIAICAVSTMDWVKENLKLKDVASGFFARFLIFFQHHDNTIPPALPTGKLAFPDFPVIEAFQEIDDLEMILSEEAESLFNKFHIQLHEQVKEYPENIREHLNPYVKRWSPYVLKISMILQQIETPGDSEITRNAMEGAIEIIRFAVKSTTFVLENELSLSEHQEKVRKVLTYIAERKGRVTRKQLLASRILGGGKSEYDYVIDTLKEQGRLSETRLAKHGVEYRLTEIE